MLTRAANLITTSNSLSLPRMIETHFICLLKPKRTVSKSFFFGEQSGIKIFFEDNMT